MVLVVKRKYFYRSFRRASEGMTDNLLVNRYEEAKQSNQYRDCYRAKVNYGELDAVTVEGVFRSFKMASA